MLEVSMGGERIGALALYQGKLAAFEYDENWLRNGFAISPFSLPLQKTVQEELGNCLSTQSLSS